MPTPAYDPVLAHLFHCFHGLRELSRPVLAPHELTMAHLFALRQLKHRGAVAMKELIEVLHVSPAGGTAVVDRLVRAGLAAREHRPLDRRVVEVRITPAGEALLSETMAAIAVPFATLREQFGEDAWQALASGLECLASALGSLACTKAEVVR